MNKFRVFVRDAPVVTSPVVVNDDFNRTVSGSWGVSESPALAWQSMFGNSTYFSVADGIAYQSAQAVNVRVVNRLDVLYSNYKIDAVVSVDTTATGAAHEIRVYGSVSSGESNKYWLKVSIDSAGVVTADIRKTVADVETRISSSTVTVSGITYTPGMKLNLEFVRNGPSLYATVWQNGTQKPDEQLFVTSDTSLASPGGVGVSTKLNTGYTGTLPTNFAFYSFSVSDPNEPNLGSLPIVGELDSYTEFSCTPRVNDVGAWSLSIPADHEQAELLKPGRGIVVFLADQAVPVFSGPAAQFQRTWSKDQSGAGMLLVSGPCDNSLFDERVGRASPDQSYLHEGDNFDFSANAPSLDWIPKVFDGTSTRDPQNSAEFIWALIGKNHKVDSGLDSQDYSRRIPHIGYSPVVPASLTALGTDTIWQGFPIRMSSIKETVFAVAEAANLNVRMLWRPSPPSGQGDLLYSNTLFLSIESVADRSNDVVFGEQAGNLSSYTLTSVRPTATRVIVGGETTSGDRRYYDYTRNDLFDPAGWQDTKDVDEWGNKLDPEQFSDPLWGRTEIETEWGTTAELFVDSRDIEWPYQPGFRLGEALAPKSGSAIAQQFDQESLKNLIDSGPQGLFQLEVIDSPDAQFGVDYNIGDTVRVLVDTGIIPSSMQTEDGVLRHPVREVTLSNKADDLWRISPVIGTADANPTPWVYKQIKKLKSKVDSDSRREELDELSHVLPSPPSFLYGGASGSARTHRPTAGQNYQLDISAGDPSTGTNGYLPVDVDDSEVELQYSSDTYAWTNIPTSLITKDSTANAWHYLSGGFSGTNSVLYWRCRVNKQGATSPWSSMTKYTIAPGALNTSGTLTLNTPTAGVYKPGTEIMLTGTDTTYGDLHVQVFDSGSGTWLNSGTDVIDPNHIYTNNSYQIPWVVTPDTKTIRVVATSGSSADFKTSNSITLIPADPNTPDFIDSYSKYQASSTGLFTYTFDQVPAGETYLALLAWHIVDNVTAPPGWTLVNEQITATAHSAVWICQGTPSSVTWDWTGASAAPRVAGIILGYEKSVLANSASQAETATQGTHTAPSLSLTSNQVPARVVRLWWDKSAGTTLITLPSGVIDREIVYPTQTSGAPSAAAADQVIVSSGSVGTSVATFNQSNANAGGYTVALARDSDQLVTATPAMLVGAAASGSTKSDTTTFESANSTAGPWRVRRSYDPGNIPSTWASSAAGPDVGKWASVWSAKPNPVDMAAGTLDASTTAFLNSIPDDHVAFVTIWHEPDVKIKQGTAPWTAAQYKAALKHFCELVRAVGKPNVYTCLIVSNYCWLNPVTGAKITDLWPGNDALGNPLVDVLAMDAYGDNTYPSPASILGQGVAAAEGYGVAWGLGELGFVSNVTNGTSAATWMQTTADYAAATGSRGAAAFLCWFDSSNGGVLPCPEQFSATMTKSHSISVEHDTPYKNFTL